MRLLKIIPIVVKKLKNYSMEIVMKPFRYTLDLGNKIKDFIKDNLCKRQKLE